jgi:N-acetylneuraminate synthase
MTEFTISGVPVGEHHPPYFIADIAANHDGDFDRALRLIELAAEAGAHAAKFQNFQAAEIVSAKGFSQLGGKFSHQAKWEKSVFEVYEDASVSWDWTARLKEHCDKVGIAYFTSPYDPESVDHVDPYVDVYKIGSGDITWIEIIEHIASKGKPVLIASGASSMQDVERAMDALLAKTDNVCLMQCNTNYTASVENFRHINLNVLKSFRKRYPDVLLGLSDHTHGHATVLGSIALGARVIEKHFTDDNSRVGPDHAFAMNPQTWRDMVDRSMELFNALGDGVKRVEDNEQETSVVQRRALRFAKDLAAGHVLSLEDFKAVRPIPEGGLAPYRVNDLVGRRLACEVERDDMVILEVLGND